MGTVLFTIGFITFWGGVGLCFLGLWGMGLLGIIIGVCVWLLLIKYEEWEMGSLYRRAQKEKKGKFD